MAHSYSHLYGVATTGLRFFTVYGPWGRPDMSPFLFADAIINGKPLKVFNYGVIIAGILPISMISSKVLFAL